MLTQHLQTPYGAWSMDRNMRSQRQTGPRSFLRQSDTAPTSKGKKTFLLPPDELSRVMSATKSGKTSSAGTLGEQNMSSAKVQARPQHLSVDSHISLSPTTAQIALSEEPAHTTASEHSSINKHTMVSGRPKSNIPGVLKWQMWSPEEEAKRQKATPSHASSPGGPMGSQNSPSRTLTQASQKPSTPKVEFTKVPAHPAGTSNSTPNKANPSDSSPQITKTSNTSAAEPSSHNRKFTPENVPSPQNTKTSNTSAAKPNSHNRKFTPENVPHAVRKWQEWRPDNKDKPSKAQDQSEICSKLSKLGVTVTPPKPYKANNKGKLDEKLTNLKPHSPPKNGSVAPRDAKAGGKQNRGRNKPRVSKWATKAEMAPQDPKRHDRSPWSEKSDAISCTMTEWSGNKYSTLHIRKYHDMTGLADWNGGWAPPPLDWDNREAFRSEQSVEQIDQWMDDVEICLDEVERAVTIADIITEDNTTYRFTVQDNETVNLKQVGEIAPRYWYEPVIDLLKADEYFDMHLSQGMPDPMDPGDLEHSKSWWQRYNKDVSNSHFLNSVQCKQDLGVDPTDENEGNRRKREADIGSWNKAQMRNLLEISKREAKKEAKRLEKRELAREMKKARARGDFNDNRCKPQVDLYIRMAEEKDIPAIHYIYNHYVERTFVTPEMEPLTPEAFQKKYQDLSYKKHNIIVACERGYTVEGRLGNPDVDLDPKVVGFAFSDDFHDFHGMHRYACKVEFYVHDAYTKKGIGKCLVDRIIAMLDPGYSARYGYDIEDGFVQTPCRPFTNVLVHFNYTKSDKLDWMTRFLNGSFGFKCIMNLENVGVKYEENVHLAIFHHRTGLELDPAKPYPLEEYGPFKPRKLESIPDRIYTRWGNRLGCSTQTSEADFCV